MPPLHVIDGTPKPRKRAGDARLAGMLQCPRCGCREVIETKVGVLLGKTGKPFGGTKSLVCADCHRKGERVVLR